VVEVVAGDEVKNFGQIKVGDFLVVSYVQSLSLELQRPRPVRPGSRRSRRR